MKKEKIFQEEKKVMKKKIIAAFLTTAMTIGSLSGVTVFAADQTWCFQAKRQSRNEASS